MNPAALIDASLSGRVLVFGSLPPHGRDLDLVARHSQRIEIERALRDSGFTQRGIQWVRFEGDSTHAVDLVPVEDWDLEPEELEGLFAEAITLEGFSQLARPSPRHTLLIMARRVARAGGELDPKKRARVRTALEEDPEGWAHAQQAAPGWSATRAVVALERSYRTGVPTSRRVRAAALAERARTSRWGAWKTVLRRQRGRGLITFSGLDGSGKTSQAEALKGSLEVTVGETVIVWTRLSYNPSLKALARPVKAVVNRRATSPPGGPGADEPIFPDAGKQLRRKSAVLTHVWATAVAVANAASQRRMTRYHLKRGRMVVCDRYTLDSRVHLRYRYGEQRRFALQARIIDALSPRPLRSYHVEVPPEVAYQRKAEQYDLAQLRSQARLYEQERSASGAVRVDGTRPREELYEEVARDVWDALT